MGRGPRGEQASSEAGSLLFGPRKARPLSDEAKVERQQKLASERDTQLQQINGWREQTEAIQEIVLRRSVGTYDLNYGSAQLSTTLSGDGQRLIDIAENIDDDFAELAAIDRQALADCGQALLESVGDIPYVSMFGNRSHSRRFFAAERINDIRRKANIALAPMVERMSETVANQSALRREAANQEYYQGLFGIDGYKQFVDNVKRSTKLLSNPAQVNNIFREGRCLEQLSASLKTIGQEQIAGDLDLAMMHIATGDRADDYSQRANSGLARLREDLGLPQPQ